MPHAMVRYESPARLSSRRAHANNTQSTIAKPAQSRAAAGCAAKTFPGSVFLHFLCFLYFLYFLYFPFLSLLRQVAMHDF
jgi:hypothetical protein